MDPLVISMISACTALVASVVGPAVSIVVSRRQINANVVSTNRHKWISELRDRTAELIALMTAVVVVRSRWHGPWNRGLAAVEQNPALLEKIERIVLVQWKIRLLLNPTEPDSIELLAAMKEGFKHLQNDHWDEQGMEEIIERITRMTQEILKSEWHRVKVGT